MNSTKIADWKKKSVADFVKLLKEYPIVGAVNMENMPAKQLQTMRSQLRDTAEIRMGKRNLINIALEQIKDEKKGIEKLSDHLKGMPALIFTKKNPFALYKYAEKNKSAMPAKAGQTAPKDVIVPAGPTGFSPGPIIGELGALRIKTGIDGGKVAIKEDSLVAKEGEVISAKLAGILARLGIEPMELGLNITAMYENGMILQKKDLHIDENMFIANLRKMASDAFNLAVHAAITTPETTKVILSKAQREAMALSLSRGIATKETIKGLLAKADIQAAALKSKSNV